MNLNQGTIKAIGSLTLLAVIAAGSFLVVKPQLEEAMSLQSQTTDMKTQTSLREDRLIIVQTRADEFDSLAEQVDFLLGRVTPDKNVTDIAGAVVNALIPGIDLMSFSHGELDPTQPKYSPPAVTLKDFPIPFDLSKPSGGGAASSSSSAGASSVNPANPGETGGNTVPKLAAAPFVLTVVAQDYQTLMNFVNVLQSQKRVITVLSVSSNMDGNGTVQATIYAYAFAGSSPEIQQWLEARDPFANTDDRKPEDVIDDAKDETDDAETTE